MNLDIERWIQLTTELTNLKLGHFIHISRPRRNPAFPPMSVNIPMKEDFLFLQTRGIHANVLKFCLSQASL